MESRVRLVFKHMYRKKKIVVCLFVCLWLFGWGLFCFVFIWGERVLYYLFVTIVTEIFSLKHLLLKKLQAFLSTCNGWQCQVASDVQSYCVLWNPHYAIPNMRVHCARPAPPSCLSVSVTVTRRPGTLPETGLHRKAGWLNTQGHENYSRKQLVYDQSMHACTYLPARLCPCSFECSSCTLLTDKIILSVCSPVWYAPNTT